MDTLKEFFAFTGALVGFITAILPLYARHVDQRQKAIKNRRSDAPIVSQIASAAVDEGSDSLIYLTDFAPLPPNSEQIARAKSLVKYPAMLLVAFGCLGFTVNLIMVTFSVIGQSNPQNVHRLRLQADREPEKEYARKIGSIVADGMYASFLIANTMAIWAGVNMYKLRSYWLSVAGSVAVMPGACFCFLLGIPVGFWSLAVLLRSEIRAAFS